jgi:hypothetical protein
LQVELTVGVVPAIAGSRLREMPVNAGLLKHA